MKTLADSKLCWGALTTISWPWEAKAVAIIRKTVLRLFHTYLLVVNNFNYFLVYNGFSINCKNMSVKNRFSTHPACNFQDQPFCVFSVLFLLLRMGYLRGLLFEQNVRTSPVQTSTRAYQDRRLGANRYVRFRQFKVHFLKIDFHDSFSHHWKGRLILEQKSRAHSIHLPPLPLGCRLALRSVWLAFCRPFPALDPTGAYG